MLCQQLLALASTESSGETEKFQTGGKPSADQAYSDQAANTALASQGHQKLTCGRYICNISGLLPPCQPQARRCQQQGRSCEYLSYVIIVSQCHIPVGFSERAAIGLRFSNV